MTEVSVVSHQFDRALMSVAQSFHTLNVAEGFITPRNSFHPVVTPSPRSTAPHPPSRFTPTPQLSITV